MTDRFRATSRRSSNPKRTRGEGLRTAEAVSKRTQNLPSWDSATRYYRYCSIRCSCTPLRCSKTTVCNEFRPPKISFRRFDTASATSGRALGLQGVPSDVPDQLELLRTVRMRPNLSPINRFPLRWRPLIGILRREDFEPAFFAVKVKSPAFMGSSGYQRPSAKGQIIEAGFVYRQFVVSKRLGEFSKCLEKHGGIAAIIVNCHCRTLRLCEEILCGHFGSARDLPFRLEI
jgi:hypothetical protein